MDSDIRAINIKIAQNKIVELRKQIRRTLDRSEHPAIHARIIEEMDKLKALEASSTQD